MKILNHRCPCDLGDSGNRYAECCSPYIDREVPAPTPLALMRSRYTAYTQANIGYIKATMCGPAAQGFDKASARRWARSVEWCGLRIISSATNAEETQGVVEFIAYYQQQGKQYQQRENSVFQRIDDRWYYVDCMDRQNFLKNA